MDGLPTSIDSLESTSQRVTGYIEAALPSNGESAAAIVHLGRTVVAV